MKKVKIPQIDVLYDEETNIVTSKKGKCNSKYDLIYVLSGRGKWITDIGEIPLEPEHFYLFRPLTYHAPCIEGVEQFKRYTFSFSRIDLSDNMFSLMDSLFIEYEETDEYDEIDIDYLNFAVVKPLSTVEIERIISGLGFLDELSCMAKYNYLSSIISQIIVILSESENKSQKVNSDRLVQRMMEYISYNIEKGKILSLDDIQAYFLVSKYYLCRIFKKHKGISIHSYINQKRVMIAKQYIDSGISAQKAAEMVGYVEYSAFYRAYVKFVGKSPKFKKG